MMAARNIKLILTSVVIAASATSAMAKSEKIIEKLAEECVKSVSNNFLSGLKYDPQYHYWNELYEYKSSSFIVSYTDAHDYHIKDRKHLSDLNKILDKPLDSDTIIKVEMTGIDRFDQKAKKQFVCGYDSTSNYYFDGYRPAEPYVTKAENDRVERELWQRLDRLHDKRDGLVKEYEELGFFAKRKYENEADYIRRNW